MSAFTNGFNFGFASGMFNRMFSSFNPFCGWNFLGGLNFMPTFINPMFNTSIFNSWQNYQQFSMPTFNNSFDWNNSCNNTQSNLSVGDRFIPESRTQSVNYSDSDTSNFSYDAKALKEKWQKKNPNLTQEFFNKVVEISKRVNCNPNDLMCLMNSESGLKSTAVNGKSKATGLIQFMPSTAEGLGTSCEALKQMSPEEQLVYVEKYIMSSKKQARLGTQKIGPGTLYALIFLPKYANQDILTVEGEIAYNNNPELDRDGDKKITKADLVTRMKECDV